MPHWPLSDRTRRARVAPVTSRPVLRHLSCGREVATSEEPRGVRLRKCRARRAWALVGPGRGCGGGGGDGRTADGLVESPRRLSPFHTRGAGPLSRSPRGPGPLFGLARPRLRCVPGRRHYEPGAHYSGFAGIGRAVQAFSATRRAGSRLRFVHARIHLFVCSFPFSSPHFPSGPAWGQLISSAASSILVCFDSWATATGLYSPCLSPPLLLTRLEKHITCLLSVIYRPAEAPRPALCHTPWLSGHRDESSCPQCSPAEEMIPIISSVCPSEK